MNPNILAKKFFSRLRHHITRPHLSTKQVAWTFAIGLAIQMNPIPFTQSFITLCLCFILKNIHKPLLILTNVINNPFTSIPISTIQLLVGKHILGDGWTINFEAIKWNEFRVPPLETLKSILIPYLTGSIALMLLSLPLGFFSMYYFSEYVRQRKNRRTETDTNVRSRDCTLVVNDK